MAHTCKSIVIHCMDFRLIHKIGKFIEEDEGLLDNYDDVSLAGAAKDLVSGSEAEREHVLKQISISCSLHCACQVVLLHHSDCGAYKGSYDFKSEAEEKAKQLEDMQKAEEVIKERFPEVEVVKVWAQMKDGNGKTVEFEKIA